MAVSLTAGVRARCQECNRFMSRPSDTCSRCGREHTFAPMHGYGIGSVEADRIAFDEDAGVVAPSSEEWDRELAQMDRAQRRWEESQGTPDYETGIDYDPGMSDSVPSSRRTLDDVRELEAKLAAARVRHVAAMRADREAGWSIKRLGDSLGLSAQAVGQQTKGAKRLPAGRPKGPSVS